MDGSGFISSDVLCTRKTRLQLMYKDVHQLKMAQMVSQPLYSVIFIYLSDAIASFLKKECEILNKISHKMYDLVVAYERHTHTAGTAASA